MTDLIPHVTVDEFDATIGGPTPVLVDFTATWCGPCKALAPVLDELATDLDGRLRIVKVDIDSSPTIAERFGVQGVPTMILFEDGEALVRTTGARPKAAVLEMVEPFLDVDR